MENSQMGNQQETDLAWLGAMLNGEGYVDVELVKAEAKTYFSPRCSISNTDPAIIVRSAEIFRSLGASYYIGKTGSRPGTVSKYKVRTNRQSYMIRCDKISSLQKLLEYVIPWMVGEKQAKAKLVLEYCRSRIERTGGKLARNQHSSIPYSDRERALVETLGSWTPNEHTLSEAEMLSRCALDSGRKPENAAEMPASA